MNSFNVQFEFSQLTLRFNIIYRLSFIAAVAYWTVSELPFERDVSITTMTCSKTIYYRLLVSRQFQVFDIILFYLYLFMLYNIIIIFYFSLSIVIN